MKRTIAEILFLLLGIALLCPSIALLTGVFLFGLLPLPTRKADGQITLISSIAFLFSLVLCLP